MACHSGMDARRFDAIGSGKFGEFGKKNKRRRPTFGHRMAVLNEDCGVRKGQAGEEFDPESRHGTAPIPLPSHQAPAASVGKNGHADGGTVTAGFRSPASDVCRKSPHPNTGVVDYSHFNAFKPHSCTPGTNMDGKRGNATGAPGAG